MKPHARRNDLERQYVDEELVIYDLTTEQAHCLNPLAARVYDLADGTRTVEEIVGEARKVDASIDTAAVWAALDALADASLLTERVAPPAGDFSPARRDLVRNVIAASTLLAVPGIATILTPRPAQAQSDVGGDTEADSKASEASAKEADGKSTAEQTQKQQAEQSAKQDAEQSAKQGGEPSEQTQKQTEQTQKQTEQTQKQNAEQTNKQNAEQQQKGGGGGEQAQKQNEQNQKDNGEQRQKQSSEQAQKQNAEMTQKEQIAKSPA